MSANDDPKTRVPEMLPPLTGEELQREQDAHWAQNDPEVERQFGGQWVVAHNRTIVAHGTDVDTVRREAAERLGCPPETLIVTAVFDPGSLLTDVTDYMDV
jgi:hypothetical protein